MKTISAYHSAKGNADFLGLRSTAKGGMEIVYDDGATRRMVWRISSADAPQDRIGDAMREALTQVRVVPALHAELKKRSIAVETVLF